MKALLIAALPGLMLVPVLLLAGCNAPPAPAPQPSGSAAPLGAAPVAPAASIAAPAPIERYANRNPDLALRQWGSAIERRNWAAVRALWGDNGADSGLRPRAFAAQWDVLRRPVVAIGAGTQEGAAGSLYYTATVTITDGPRTISAPITIRRANDVPGATPAQLRWHADASVRAPWTSLR